MSTMESPNLTPTSITDESGKRASTFYPSRFAIGERVKLTVAPTPIYAYIRAITFTSGKVRYALYVKDSTTTLHNIDSAFVEPVEENQRDFIDFDFDNFS